MSYLAASLDFEIHELLAFGHLFSGREETEACRGARLDWMISEDTSQDVALHKNNSVGIYTDGLAGHEFGTVILILPEIHGSPVPGYARFGIDLLMACAFGGVEV